MKVTRDTLHEIYDALQSILNSSEIIINPIEAALRKAKKIEVVSVELDSFFEEKE
ncbi:hypothetical protein [Bacillus cereus]|uniref:hypothetical protein n=1 Tax=Bacillus cereus TaxID=1396 RepID=UPI002FDBAD66|nr:hypothetical protein [Bacillus cereus]